MSGSHNKLYYGNNLNHWKFFGLGRWPQLFFFFSPKPNPNPTHLLKHECLRSNNRFCQRIWYVECYSVHAYMEWSQKFRLTQESLFNFGSSRSLCGPFLSTNMGKLRLDRWLWPESDSQIWKIAGPGFKNFGIGAESQKVTPATSDTGGKSLLCDQCKLLCVAGTNSCKRSWYCECAVQMFQRLFCTEQWYARVIFVESESSKNFSSWVLSWSSRFKSQELLCHWFTSSSQFWVKWNPSNISLCLFLLWNGSQQATKWHRMSQKRCPVLFKKFYSR